MEEKNIVALEIGSSKVKGAVGRIDDCGVLTVQAVEEEPLHDCVRYGVVSNVEEVATITARILRKLENRLAPRKIKSVYLAIGGRSLGVNIREAERQLPDEMEVTDLLLRQLKHEVGTRDFSDRELLEVIPREYMVDKVVVSRPQGTFGRNVRMSANLITCRPQLKRNLDRIITEKLQLRVSGYIVRQRAQGDAVLTDEEKRLGCMLVDFGAETTTVSIYKNGRMQYLATLPLGSRNITRDITARNYLEEQAEELKRDFGNAVSGAVEHPVAGSAVDVASINNYVSHRSGEIIANINEQITYAGMKPSDIPAGIVLVGRGARLRGFNERLSTTTGLKVRSGSIVSPQVVIADSRISPSDAVDVLSVLYGASLTDPAECLYTPAPEPVPEPEPVQESVIEDIDAASEQASVKRKSFMDSIKKRIAGILSEPEEDDDELREDPD